MSNRIELISHALKQRREVHGKLNGISGVAYVRVATENAQYLGISLNDAMNLWADNREKDDSRVVTVG